ncbi:MAG: DUF3298 and DUF4163 domain-containing protein [Cellulosilyticum sp.]|nr:DUF3298 and DUF4163 domain-containing protein [Cellulosilyticum sp.]
MKKKNQVRAMYFIFCLMMCLPQMQYAKSAKNPRTPGTAIFVMATTQVSPSITDKTFTVKKDGLNLEMHIPQFSNLSNSDFEKQVNHYLLKEATKRKKAMIEMAKSYNKDFIKDGLTPIPFEYIETFSIIPTIYPYYTLELYQYQYSGGAHGISELSYINLNQEKNQLLNLADLFKEDVDYQSIVNELVKQEIERRQELGEFFFSGSDGFQSIGENRPFFINKDGDLVIVFNVYEIAPYASGPIYITIPRAKLIAYLK